MENNPTYCTIVVALIDNIRKLTKGGQPLPKLTFTHPIPKLVMRTEPPKRIVSVLFACLLDDIAKLMEDQIVKSVNKFSFFSLSFFFFFEHFPLVNYASVANGDNEVKQAFTK